MENMTIEAEVTKDLLGYSLRNDIVFKYVFGLEKNEKILRALLNAILGLEGDERIVSLSFMNPDNLKEYLKDKFTTLDVKVKDSTGKRYNIEMQVRVDSSYIARAIYYHDKLFSGQLTETESFDLLKRTLSISILNHLLLEKEIDLHNVYRYANIKSGRELTDIKELHFIELPKFRKDKPKQLMTKFEKWLYVLKFGENYSDNPEGLPDTLKAEEEIVMAIERMHEALSDEMVRELMEHREKALHDEATRMFQAKREAEREGMEKGLEKGMEKGKIEGKAEVARELKKMGHDIGMIVKVTGLSLEEVEKI
ncbi:MAG: Rpn family recombination-promoting nuclease/putative transposase [Candidatus Xenobiia bacterium LiM19]